MVKYVVALVEHRGHSLCKTEEHSAGYLPEDMLKDGTVVTIRRNQGGGWCYLNECRNYSYPIHLLKPLTPTKTSNTNKTTFKTRKESQ